jgi:NAD(P)-dependent dehydrogenase (short-subunit alcohol dehydrogenase family)
VTNEKDTKNILDSTVSHFGRLDVLVNNAGILEMGTIETSSLEQYDRVFNTNVRSIYHLTQLAVPHLILSKGNVVNVSSVNGLRSVTTSSVVTKLAYYLFIFSVPWSFGLQYVKDCCGSIHPLCCS